MPGQDGKDLTHKAQHSYRTLTCKTFYQSVTIFWKGWAFLSEPFVKYPRNVFWTSNVFPVSSVCPSEDGRRAGRTEALMDSERYFTCCPYDPNARVKSIGLASIMINIHCYLQTALPSNYHESYKRYSTFERYLQNNEDLKNNEVNLHLQVDPKEN